MEALALKSFQFLVRCFWEIEGGCGGLPLRTSLFGRGLLLGSMGMRRGVGVLGIIGMILGLACGRR